MRVRTDDRNEHFVKWVHSLGNDPSKEGPVTIPTEINQSRTVESFYDQIYPPALLARAYIDQNVFRNRAILSVRNDTVTEINKSILNRLTGTATDFFLVDAVKANSIDADGA